MNGRWQRRAIEYTCTNVAEVPSRCTHRLESLEQAYVILERNDGSALLAKRSDATARGY
jgi:hypothetical protein